MLTTYKFENKSISLLYIDISEVWNFFYWENNILYNIKFVLTLLKSYSLQKLWYNLHYSFLFLQIILQQTHTGAWNLHSCPKLSLQPVLSFSSFVYNSSINELKNMKLRENICFEIINWILYYWSFRNNLQMNTNDFFLKKYVLKKEKILMFFGK